MKSQVLGETFFMARGLARMQRIYADFMFNPYGVNILIRHRFTIIYALRARVFTAND